MSAAERKSRYEAIQHLFKAASDLSDQQVALAVQTYDSVCGRRGDVRGLMRSATGGQADSEPGQRHAPV